ncbi:hypothetical protein [Luteimonas aquatica]|uniref:hypothetical protein n=1 Tax=Luteimonas aquatica TaxID=450364 RepID=UPI001F5AC9C1|nr:hypothetical protein [Luteimonas aquatica]
MPKTATSALQRWLHRNALLLASAGACYPDGAHLRGDKHQFLVGELRRGGTTLARLLPRLRHTTAIFSAEGLSNHFYDFDPAALRRFRQDTAGIDIEILMVTREREAWLRSYHKQCVVNPGNGASDLWGTALTAAQIADHPRIRRLTDARQLGEDLLRGFGARRLHRLRFEEDWFAATLALLGLDAATAPPLPRANDSLPDWAVEVLRRLNGIAAPERHKDYWKSALAAFLGSNHLELNAAAQADAMPPALAGEADAIRDLLSGWAAGPDLDLALRFLATADEAIAHRRPLRERLAR